MLPNKYAVHPSTAEEGKELREWYFSIGANRDDFDDPEKLYNGLPYDQHSRWFGVIKDDIISGGTFGKWWWDNYHPSVTLLTMEEFRALKKDNEK